MKKLIKSKAVGSWWGLRLDFKGWPEFQSAINNTHERKFYVSKDMKQRTQSTLFFLFDQKRKSTLFFVDQKNKIYLVFDKYSTRKITDYYRVNKIGLMIVVVCFKDLFV